MRRFIIFALSTMILATTFIAWRAWDSTVDNVNDYLAWVNHPDNQVIRQRSARGIRISVKYLAPEFLAYREMRNRDRFERSFCDSLLAMYEHSLAFLMTFEPERSMAKGDVVYKDVQGYDDYAARMKKMNFGMEQLLELRLGAQTLTPRLALLENVYSLKDSRNVLLLFTPAEGAAFLRETSKLDLCFFDEIFDTGIHHFVFSKNDINALPDFPFQSLALN